jgi:superfamily II DNA/RNA helicase
MVKEKKIDSSFTVFLVHGDLPQNDRISVTMKLKTEKVEF